MLKTDSPPQFICCRVPCEFFPYCTNHYKMIIEVFLCGKRRVLHKMSYRDSVNRYRKSWTYFGLRNSPFDSVPFDLCSLNSGKTAEVVPFMAMTQQGT